MEQTDQDRRYEELVKESVRLMEDNGRLLDELEQQIEHLTERVRSTKESHADAEVALYRATTSWDEKTFYELLWRRKAAVTAAVAMLCRLHEWCTRRFLDAPELPFYHDEGIVGVEKMFNEGILERLFAEAKKRQKEREERNPQDFSDVTLCRRI